MTLSRISSSLPTPTSMPHFGMSWRSAPSNRNKALEEKPKPNEAVFYCINYRHIEDDPNAVSTLRQLQDTYRALAVNPKFIRPERGSRKPPQFDPKWVAAKATAYKELNDYSWRLATPSRMRRQTDLKA